MNNIEHKERLDFAEFRELLHDGMVIAMCNVLSELIPDKEDATFGKTIRINDFCQPIFKRVQIGNQPNFMSRRTMAVVWMADNFQRKPQHAVLPPRSNHHSGSYSQSHDPS